MGNKCTKGYDDESKSLSSMVNLMYLFFKALDIGTKNKPTHKQSKKNKGKNNQEANVEDLDNPTTQDEDN